MKYKELALEKVEKLQNTLKTMEHHLNRNDIQASQQLLKNIVQQVENIQSQISIEQ